MKLIDVKQVKHATTENEVNKALKQGYKILKMAQNRIKTPECEDVKIQYCLGK